MGRPKAFLSRQYSAVSAIRRSSGVSAVCVCVCVCMRACACVRVHVCVHVCVHGVRQVGKGANSVTTIAVVNFV